MEHSDAVVIRTVDFSETSLILSLYTRDFGKIECLAKGGRRLKSPFESALDILAQIRVTFLQKRGDTLDLLTESKLAHRFQVKRRNLAGLMAGFYMAELMNLLTERNDPNQAIFDLAVETLDSFEQGRSVMKHMIRFEYYFLKLTGQQPSLRHCVECGLALQPDGRDRIHFGHLEGGVICSQCAPAVRELGGGGLTTVSTKAMGALVQLLRSRDNVALAVEPRLLGEIRGLFNNYISHQIGRRPRLYDWLAFIGKNDNPEDEISTSD